MNEEKVEVPAPRGLRPEEVSRLIEELIPILTEARLDKVHDEGASAFRLRWRAPGGRRDLLLSCRAGFSRFHLLTPRSAEGTPSEAAMSLRELLRNGKVTGIDQPGGDRIMRVTLNVVRDGRRIQRSVIHELFGSRGRLLVVEGERRIVRFIAGRGGISVGESYRFAPAPPARKGEVPFPFDPDQLIPLESRDDPCAFHLALGERMTRAEQEADRRERREGIARTLHRERKRRLELARKLAASAASADRWEEHQRHGDLLKGELGRLKRGLDRIVVTDYYDPDLAEVEIPLDPRKTPQENMERLFHRARKARRSIEAVAARRRLCDEDLAILDEVEEALSSDDADLEDLEQRLRRLHHGVKVKGRGQRRRVRGEPAPAGPRRFRSREGLDILAGRSARENDRLTRGIARGNDLFFHIAHRPGPHIILRVPKGRQASPESIDDAAFVAAYLSGWRGPGLAIVQWTHVKYIRKPKGLAPGQVLVSRDREHRVPYAADRIATLGVDPDEEGASAP